MVHFILTQENIGIIKADNYTIPNLTEERLMEGVNQSNAIEVDYTYSEYPNARVFQA